MTPERWRAIEALYHAARNCAPAERAAFVQDACGSDEALRREVEALLAQPVSDGGPLATGAGAAALPTSGRASDRSDPALPRGTLIGP